MRLDNTLQLDSPFPTVVIDRICHFASHTDENVAKSLMTVLLYGETETHDDGVCLLFSGLPDCVSVMHYKPFSIIYKGQYLNSACM